MKKKKNKWKKIKGAYGKCTGLGRIFSLGACICLLLGAAMPVYGREPEKEETSAQEEEGNAPRIVVTDIYHRHIGNADEEGGCYSVPMNHVHQGDERTGGDCYQIPVYHTHQGSEDMKGGCYTRPVEHKHQGDKVHGGACYVPDVTHTHTEACMETNACLVSFTPESVISTQYDTCFKHNHTIFVKSRGTEIHDSCGQGRISGEWLYCQSCGVISPTIHEYKTLVCQIQEGSVISYRVKCDKVIDRYETGCNKNEKDIDGYALDCDKTLDGYGLGCGLDEKVPCGRLVVANETAGREE